MGLDCERISNTEPSPPITPHWPGAAEDVDREADAPAARLAGAEGRHVPHGPRGAHGTGGDTAVPLRNINEKRFNTCETQRRLTKNLATRYIDYSKILASEEQPEMHPVKNGDILHPRFVHSNDVHTFPPSHSHAHFISLSFFCILLHPSGGILS